MTTDTLTALTRLEARAAALACEWELRRVLGGKKYAAGYRATLEGGRVFVVAWGATVAEAVERVLVKAEEIPAV